MSEKKFMYLGIDIETTGLDVATCGILQIGAMLIDPEDLSEVGRQCFNVEPPPISTFEPAALKMHRESGLLHYLRGTYTYSPRGAVDALRQVVKNLRVDRPGVEFVPFGRNVRKFDLAILDREGFGSKELLHYRTADLSSFFVVCDLILHGTHREGVQEGWLDRVDTSDLRPHWAIDDLERDRRLLSEIRIGGGLLNL